MSDFKPKGHIAMIASNSLWGLMSPVAKVTMAAGTITPLLMTDFRIIGAAILFWITSLFTRHEHVPPRDLLRLAFAATLGILLNQGSFIFGVGMTSPGEASIITTTMPVWVMILAALFLKEPITTRKTAGIIVGAAGALILIINSNNTAMSGDKPLIGDILVLTAQLCYALYLTLFKNFIARYSLVTLMKWMFTFAAVMLLPLSIPTIAATSWSQLTAAQWLGAGYVVAGGTYVAYICVMIGQKNLRPTIVGMYNYVQPIIATCVGIYLGLDRFTPLKMLAVLLIFSGVFLVTTSRARARAGV